MDKCPKCKKGAVAGGVDFVIGIYRKCIYCNLLFDREGKIIVKKVNKKGLEKWM